MYKGFERFYLGVMVMKRRINAVFVELIKLTGRLVEEGTLLILKIRFRNSSNAFL